MTDHNFDSDLRMTIQRLSRRLRAERADETISDGQLSVLAALAKDGPLGLSELSRRERVTPPSMNRTVGALVDAGYTSRVASTEDGRKVVIDLTAEGRRMIEETRQRRDAWFSRRLAELTDDQRQSLAAAAPILRELADS
ncbi:DNA-binding MarR family transcriptional regulator [Glaciihabitans tibetensis]|uniref:DNA-binding MarR family transcriptional regulator n=1 Tax=Glaciihabitans tibetensis TaxID=1266600 RepID=A0A2T0V9W0_9MICO|nr:MarR family transcriptional regulator [Glaciihabitans tibetensis]PRY66934.1 DNA-binding MarR family transcriptional regulator [Glaciihabitans tibetensis]